MTEDQEFHPTALMRLYAYQRAKQGLKAKDSAISKIVGVAPETISRWKKVNGFKDWLTHEISYYSVPVISILEQKALEQIRNGDFRYWEALYKFHSNNVIENVGFEFSGLGL